MTFYERLTKLMKERGLSHKDLENELKFSNGSISKWKNSTPTLERFQKLADYFGVSVEYLRTGEEKKSSFSKESAKLVGKIRNDKDLSNALEKYFTLSEAKKKHVLELIDLLSEV